MPALKSIRLVLLVTFFAFASHIPCSIAAELECITEASYRMNKEFLEELGPLADVTKITLELARSMKRARVLMDSVSTCRLDSDFIDEVFGGCSSIINEYNTEATRHNMILGQLDNAKSLQPLVIEKRRLLGLPRCASVLRK